MIQGRFLTRSLARPLFALALVGLVGLGACSGGGSGGGSDGAPVTPPVTPPPPPPPPTNAPFQLPATLEAQPLGDAANTETLFVVAHGTRLFASTGQWTAPQSTLTGGQVLVKDGPSSSWREFERAAVVRLSALASFTVPARYNSGREVQVLLAFDRDTPTSPPALVWLRDNESSFTQRYALPPGTSPTIRAFGALDDGQSFAFFTAVSGLGIIRGVWDSAAGTIQWSPTPELPLVADTTENGDPNRVKSFASCNGAIYATVTDTIYRRNDGPLTGSQTRWVAVYTASDALGSGIRGLTCVQRTPATSALLASVEGPGTILRWDDLPLGNVSPGARITPVVEAEVRDVIRAGLAEAGTTLPASGFGSVGYIIAAYNNFQPMDTTGDRRIYGLEWAYSGNRACPSSRTCVDTSDFDAAACVIIRTNGTTPTHRMRCLAGTALTPRPDGRLPVQSGEAFVATRTIARSPWTSNEYYLGGFDANSIESVGTAWLARAVIE